MRKSYLQQIYSYGLLTIRDTRCWIFNPMIPNCNLSLAGRLAVWRVLKLLFYLSISLLGLGGGGIRGSVPALGADQTDYRDPEERLFVATFFNWFLLSITIGASIGVTFVVYVSTTVGWEIGFIISMSCSFVGLIFAALGKPSYRVRVAGDSPLLRIVEV